MEKGRFVVLNIVPGLSSCQSAYRSELSGIYGSVCAVEQVCVTHKVIAGRVTIGCDGEEALWLSAESDELVGPSNSDYDLISAIRAKIEVLPVEVDTHWVKGHQDDLALSENPWICGLD